MRILSAFHFNRNNLCSFLPYKICFGIGALFVTYPKMQVGNILFIK